MAKLVLVTGASGFIAMHVVKLLLKEGYAVRGTVRSLADPKKLKPIEDLKSDIPDASLELVEANLTTPDGWDKVVEGCDYVLHMASPFPATNPKNEDELIKPAVEGTLNVLRACGPSVQRVVLTSSVASVSSGHDAPPNGDAFTEDDWTDVDKVHTVYEKSKTLAEKAAWDYMKELRSDQRFDLAAINPVIVFGPVYGSVVSTTVEFAKRILGKEMPMLPHLNFNIVDVRDVALAHVTAMTKPEAAGKRHILVGRSIWMQEVAKIIEAEFKPMGYSIPTSVAPYALLWMLGRFDASVRMILPFIGKQEKFSRDRMTNVLGIEPRPIEETVSDMCHALVAMGAVKKTAKYVAKETKP